MALSIAALVAGSLSVIAVIGGAVGYVGHSQQVKSKWAAQVWRDVTLRNGVGESSPFHSERSSINIPGMVEVFPRSHVPNDEQVCPESLPLTSDSQGTDENMVSTGFNQSEELTIEPFELSDPPHEAERARVRRLYSQGMSQTKLISNVWGVSKGGGKKYTEARRRFREHVADIATGDLRASIEAEGAAVNA